MKSWIQHIKFLCNDKQNVVTEAIYIFVYTIFLECLYMLMLFYPLEEQFDFPSFHVQLGNG